MFAHRPALRTSTWLALIAMLALALLPTVSHARAHSRGQSNWAEVCTPQGMRVVALYAPAKSVDGASGAPVQAGGHLEHCPYCGLGATALGMPPAGAPPLVLPLLPGAVPALFLQGPRTPFAWRTAQPRGPPASS